MEDERSKVRKLCGVKIDQHTNDRPLWQWIMQYEEERCKTALPFSD